MRKSARWRLAGCGALFLFRFQPHCRIMKGMQTGSLDTDFRKTTFEFEKTEDEKDKRSKGEAGGSSRGAAASIRS